MSIIADNLFDFRGQRPANSIRHCYNVVQSYEWQKLDADDFAFSPYTNVTWFASFDTCCLEPTS